jgi:hypothetical protein
MPGVYHLQVKGSYHPLGILTETPHVNVFPAEWWAAFSPDGTTLASVSIGNIQLWKTSLESWISRGCQIAGRNLSQDEWNQFINPGRPYQRTCKDFPPGQVRPSLPSSLSRSQIRILVRYFVTSII